MLLIRNVHNRGATAAKAGFTTEACRTGMNLKEFMANGGTMYQARVRGERFEPRWSRGCTGGSPQTRQKEHAERGAARVSDLAADVPALLSFFRDWQVPEQHLRGRAEANGGQWTCQAVCIRRSNLCRACRSRFCVSCQTTVCRPKLVRILRGSLRSWAITMCWMQMSCSKQLRNRSVNMITKVEKFRD